jgi:hypothetical protein
LVAIDGASPTQYPSGREELVETVGAAAAGVLIDELVGSPPPWPHTANVRALALVASTAQLDRDAPMLKLPSSKGASRIPQHQCRAPARAFKEEGEFVGPRSTGSG